MIILFGFFPAVSFFVAGNFIAGTIFVVTAVVTVIRINFSPSKILTEMGTMDVIASHEDERNKEWRKKNKIHKILQYSEGDASTFDTYVLISSILVCIFLIISNIDVNADVRTFTPEFEYPGSNSSLRYPTCKLDQVGTLTDLTDISFLSGIAYEKSQSETVKVLSQWFDGFQTVVNHQDIVDDIKSYNYLDSPVVYKFIGFPDIDVGVVAIGTMTMVRNTLLHRFLCFN